MSGINREVPLKDVESGLLRRSRLSDEKSAEALGFTGIRKPQPAWLSKLEEEAKRYYKQQLLAFAQFHHFLTASELKAEAVCAYLSKTFSITFKQPSPGRYHVTVPAFSDAIQTQRAVEGGLLLFLSQVPTTQMLEVRGGETTQYLPLLKALLYLPCTLGKGSWERIQHQWAQEQTHWEEKEEKGKNKPPRAERQVTILQRQALSYLTAAKHTLLQEAWDQKLSTQEQSQYLKTHVAKRVVAAVQKDLSQHKVPDRVAEACLKCLLDMERECQTLLGKASVDMSAPLRENKEKEEKSRPLPQPTGTRKKWIPFYQKGVQVGEEEVDDAEAEDEEETLDEEKDRFTATSH